MALMRRVGGKKQYFIFTTVVIAATWLYHHSMDNSYVNSSTRKHSINLTDSNSVYQELSMNLTRTRMEVYHRNNLSEYQKKQEILTEPLYDLSPVCTKEFFLLIMVTTGLNNLKRRNTIRDSYAKVYPLQSNILNSSKPFKNKNFVAEDVVGVAAMPVCR